MCPARGPVHLEPAQRDRGQVCRHRTGHGADERQRDDDVGPRLGIRQEPQRNSARNPGRDAGQGAADGGGQPSIRGFPRRATKPQPHDVSDRCPGIRRAEQRDFTGPGRTSHRASRSTARASLCPGRASNRRSASSVPSACNCSAASRRSSSVAATNGGWRSNRAMSGANGSTGAGASATGGKRTASAGAPARPGSAQSSGSSTTPAKTNLIAVPRHRAHELRIARIVAEASANRAHRLAQRAVRDDHVGPDAIENLLACDGAMTVRDEQDEQIEVTRDHRHVRVTALHDAVCGRDEERAETESRHVRRSVVNQRDDVTPASRASFCRTDRAFPVSSETRRAAVSPASTRAVPRESADGTARHRHARRRPSHFAARSRQTVHPSRDYARTRTRPSSRGAAGRGTSTTGPRSL